MAKAKQVESGFEKAKNMVCMSEFHEPPRNLHVPYGKVYRHICPHCGEQVVLQSLEVYCK